MSAAILPNPIPTSDADDRGDKGRAPRVVCLIPARWESSRFPGKPLADLGGWPMIRHVYERVRRSPLVSWAGVATDDERIAAAVRAFGGHAIMTAAVLRSGTDRIAAAAAMLDLADDDIVVNVQADQPLFAPSQIEEVVRPLRDDPALPMATLIYRIVLPEEITHAHAVKVVFDRRGRALYFSRATIPYVRDAGQEATYYKHHGIYAYRRWFLPVFAGLPEGEWERLEKLEQLRALEHGYAVGVAVTAEDSLEVDSPEELRRVREMLRAGGEEADEAPL
jgi:3-deoxy-manno-octulosonate cytidylyltransferase (CMP-KDO synthetase)